MHKEALGDFNQALDTRGQTGGRGSALHKEMAPGKGEDRGSGRAGALWRSPDPVLRLRPPGPRSGNLPPQPRAQEWPSLPSFLWGHILFLSGTSGAPSTRRGPSDLSRALGPKPAQSFLGL